MPRALAAFAHHHPGLATLALLVVLYVLFHHKHYRAHRRGGLSVWVSMRGPWGTRVSKRL